MNVLLRLLACSVIVILTGCVGGGGGEAPSASPAGKAAKAAKAKAKEEKAAAVITPTAKVVAAPLTSFVVNGGFESGLTGWTTSGNLDVATVKGTVNKALRFNAGQKPPNGKASQVIKTVSGQSYVVSFDYGVYSPVGGAKEQRVEIKVKGASTLATQTIIQSGGATVKFVPRGISFKADGAAATIVFSDVSTRSDSVDSYVDNVQMTPAGLTPTPTPTPTPVPTPTPSPTPTPTPAPTATPIATSLTLAWDASTDTATKGYVLRYGKTRPKSFFLLSKDDIDPVIDLGPVLKKQITGLENGVLYYFALSAYAVGADANGTKFGGRLESLPVEYSTVCCPSPTPVPTP